MKRRPWKRPLLRRSIRRIFKRRVGAIEPAQPKRRKEQNMQRLIILSPLWLLLLECQTAPPYPVCPQLPARPTVAPPPPPRSFTQAWCARHSTVCDPTTGKLLEPTG